MTDRHDAVVSGQDTALTPPRPGFGDDRPRPTGIVCASAILKRSLSEAIELQAMELAPDQQGTWSGRDEQPLVPHRVRVLVTLGGPAARRSLYQACVRAGLADLAGPVTDAPQPRVGCLDVCERLATALAPQRSVDSGQVVELDRLQVGGMY